VILYVDSSVILRRILGQSGALEGWEDYEGLVASALAEVECLRTLDRLRVLDRLDDGQVVAWRAGVFELLHAAEIFDVTRVILRRAAQPMATTLGTLDAIHLATALLWRERHSDELAMATHDHALGAAARASGLGVLGL
jgi:predicted nucleic acid-binding protein